MYEIKIPPNRRLTTPLFCKHGTLRCSLECEFGTAVEPFRETNNNVKPTCHKIYQRRYYYLFIFFFLNICFLLQSSRCRSNALCLLTQLSGSSANGRSFVLLNFKSLRATGWLKNAKIATITTDNASFIWNLYTKINYKYRKLILVVLWRYEWNNRRHTMCTAVIPFIPSLNDKNQLSIFKWIKISMTINHQDYRMLQV